MYRSMDDVVEENRLDYSHSIVKVVLTADVPKLGFGGKSFDDLRKGVVLNVWSWVADVLVSKGFAEYVTKPPVATTLMQMEWRERNNPGELQPVSKHFYAEFSKEVERDDYVGKKFLDIVTLRMMKVVNLAAKRLDGEVVRRMTPEEEALYKRVYVAVDEWLKAVTGRKGEK